MTKKIENLKGMNQDELKRKLVELQEKLRALKFRTEGSKSKNVKESVSLRKQVAKVLTEINSAKGKAGKKK
jgi:ribosomal protein L29